MVVVVAFLLLVAEAAAQAPQPLLAPPPMARADWDDPIDAGAPVGASAAHRPGGDMWSSPGTPLGGAAGPWGGLLTGPWSAGGRFGGGYCGSEYSGYGLPDDLQLLPEGLVYRSYLAGVRESRFGSVWFYERDQGWLWDSALGGRVGLLRYGTRGYRPEGFQIDVEGAAFPRLDLEEDLDLVSTDFRVGVPLTYARGPWEAKLAYYHLSSHLGDEFLLKTGATRDNYSRDAIVVGLAVRPVEPVRLYAEAGWSYYTSGRAEPWEFQFGIDLASLRPTSLAGAPFAAVNAHLREEVDFGGNFVAQLGWQWRGESGQALRTGFQYLNGKSPQFEFVNQFEEQFGIGLWYDF